MSNNRHMIDTARLILLHTTCNKERNKRKYTETRKEGRKTVVNRQQVSQIEKSLRHVSYIVKQKGREILNEFPITPPQFVALQWLQEEGDMTIGELSQRMYLACSTTTDLIDRMEKNELVERVKDEKDRRVVRIHLLEKGTIIIKDVINERQIYLEGVLSEMSPEEVMSIEQGMAALQEKMNQLKDTADKEPADTK